MAEHHVRCTRNKYATIQRIEPTSSISVQHCPCASGNLSRGPLRQRVTHPLLGWKHHTCQQVMLSTTLHGVYASAQAGFELVLDNLTWHTQAHTSRMYSYCAKACWVSPCIANTTSNHHGIMGSGTSASGACRVQYMYADGTLALRGA